MGLIKGQRKTTWVYRRLDTGCKNMKKFNPHQHDPVYVLMKKGKKIEDHKRWLEADRETGRIIARLLGRK